VTSESWRFQLAFYPSHLTLAINDFTMKKKRPKAPQIQSSRSSQEQA
jgi:hypothetical protein